MVATNVSVKRHASIRQRRLDIAGYLFISPAIIGFLLFFLVPIGYSLVLAFMKWNMVTPMQYVGIGNLVSMANDDVVFKSMTVTMYYTLLAVPLVNLYALAMAMLLNNRVKGLSVFRTVFYIPTIVPAVAAAALWMFIFNPINGVMNSIVTLVGIPKQMWIFSEQQVIPCIAVMAAWGSGSTMVIYLAGLQGIPQHLYESIDIDGGNAWNKFKSITLPLLSPVIFYNLVMTIILSMQAFTQSYIMTKGKGGPNNASLFYVMLLYKRAFEFSDMGMACAMAWVLFIAIGVLTGINFYVSNRWVYYEGA